MAKKTGGQDGRKNNGKHLQRITAAGSNLQRSGKMPQRLTKNAWNRMHDEFDYDPLAAAVNVAKGKGLTEDHPFLKPLIDALTDIRKKAATGAKIDPDSVDTLIKLAEEMLTDSWVTHELRGRFILELLSYIYPKRKAIEATHSGSVQVDMTIKPMMASEIVDFKQVFDDRY